jgi:uncharacterized membrane protein required for colicin V production
MFDALVLFLILIMVLVGFTRGMAREIWALVILLAAVVLTGILYIPLASFLNHFFANEAACRLISFLGLFLVMLGVMNVVVDAATGRDRRKRIDEPGTVSRVIGAALGAVEGLLYLQVAATIILAFSISFLDSMVKQSFLVRATMQLPIVLRLLPLEFRDITSFLH